MKFLFSYLYYILVYIYFVSAQSGVVYDENQKSVQFHITLWIVITFIVAFLLGTYATYRISHTKDSLLYSKINASSNTK
ncbi:hypothetical protein PGSY75_0613100 [Plasmodium gaboni]|uniref:Uncharacterized protein n=1 Tax=Plasmodium gaboni TaxID=647221 RepID=A0A151LRP8_9APIC|nr:hypothetical protein PGSY75_0613100 [Plasmodium gaboni]KYO01827.1 hypothetical protein PGSY75_0613100 [Plasmodium gaboni]SOV12255.1 conserved Plasmodium protein, unknown function [Plasmodium gaboni]